MKAFVVKLRSEWARQARTALDTLEQKGATEETTLRQMADIDHAAFSTLIEALVALAPETGEMPDAELVRLAGLRPVEEVLGL